MAARHRQPRDRSALFSDAMVPWIPMLVGVVIMAGYVIYALALSVGDRSPADLGGTDLGGLQQSPPGLGPATSGPAADQPDFQFRPAELPPGRALAQIPTPTPSPTPAPEPTESPSPEPPEPEPDVVGKYRLDASYRDVFIGKVVIVNRSEQPQDWTVELAFPTNVGKLNTFWVDGTPQPTVERSGDGHVFTSTVPVQAGSWVVLKFHYDRKGNDVNPTVCTVNDTPCLLP